VSIATADSYVFVVLFRGQDGTRIEQMLRTAVHPAPSHPIQVQMPAVRGVDFLSSGPQSAALDEWWAGAVAEGGLPVYLVMDEPGLEEWIPGTMGCWFVGVTSSRRAALLGSLDEPVFPVRSEDCEIVAEQAMQAIDRAGDASIVFHPGFPYREAPGLWTQPVPTLASLPTPPLANGGGVVRTVSRVSIQPPRPPTLPITFDNPDPPDMANSDIYDEDAPSIPSQAARLRTGLTRAAALVRAYLTLGTPRASTSLEELGRTVNANRPLVIAFGSRKGGVGKTTHAAAAAATVGEALDGLADTAALVDGNVTNPDSWALNPPVGTATVRTLVSRLTLGLAPPPEQYARTPRLAIYPESRNSEEVYTQAEVDVLAEYFRRRHAFIAVDLPNALPSLIGGGAGAVAAAWLMHTDLVVLPFNADPRARQGLFDYVDALQDDDVFARIPVIAPYIMSSNRAVAGNPEVLTDIGRLERLGVEIIEVPDDDSVLLALLRDLPINRASWKLRQAYLSLTQRIVAAVVADRSRK
jgi:hypothetical protein